MPVISVERAISVEYSYMEFTVRLSEPATDAVTVQYAAVPGTTGLNDLWYNLDGEVVFAAGETVKTIRIFAGTDTLDELDESFLLELRNPVGASFGPNTQSLSAVGWVLDDDGPGNNNAIAVSNAAISEAGGGKAVFTVSLSQAFGTDRSFTFTTFDGSAEAGADYVARSGVVTFLAGQTEATVEIDLLNNSLAEATERFGLTITGAHGVNGATGTAQVLDDDAAPPVLSIESARSLEYGYMYFTVRLSEPATDAVTVQYAAIPGTTGSSDLWYDLDGEVVFTAGETVKTIRIFAGTDTLDELDESFFLELRNPVGASFGGGNRGLLATGWVLDDPNDGPFLNRTVAVAGADIVEGPGGRVAVFAVEISTPHSAPLTLNYQTVNGTALAGRDYLGRSGQVTFAAGQTRAEITIPILDDLTPEAIEQFYLRVAPPFPSAISASSNLATATATIVDGTLRGTAGNDALRGTAAGEAIDGLAGHDRILGLGGNDRLWGNAGNDTLEGGAGADTLIGGAGNDAYGVDASDVVVESAGGGIDTVYSPVSLTLAANVENLTLTGAGNTNGTGNGLHNILMGNAGLNTLGGGAGNDTYVVGAGDRVFEVANAGVDTVRSATTHVLPANVENLVLTGAGNINGTGNALHNTLVGGAGLNVLGGGAGNDTYVIGAGDRVIEGANAGVDTVRSTATHVLSANVENLTLTGAGNINGTGNALNNVLTGGAGANILGGGWGHDSYVIGPGDRVIEAANAGTDSVFSTATHALSANVENLTLTGAGNANGTGNVLANRITGNAGANILDGGAGADTLSGGAGADILGGGADRVRDVFAFHQMTDFGAWPARDQIYGFLSGTDLIYMAALDASSAIAGVQDFVFSGTTARHNAVWYVRQQNDVLVLGDHTGDGRADFAFLVRNQTTLSGDDFIF